MLRLLLPTVAVALALVGCGSDDSAPPDAARSTPSGSASPTASVKARPYFRKADSDAINAAAGPAQAAIREATTSTRSCNRFTDYAAWRRCWHRLLDPVTSGLARTAGVMRNLAGHDLPKVCVGRLQKAAGRFRAARGDVVALLGAVDGDDYAVQKRAVNHADATLRRAGLAYTETFPRLTDACYSPADLASISASPSESGS